MTILFGKLMPDASAQLNLHHLSWQRPVNGVPGGGQLDASAKLLPWPNPSLINAWQEEATTQLGTTQNPPKTPKSTNKRKLELELNFQLDSKRTNGLKGSQLRASNTLMRMRMGEVAGVAGAPGRPGGRGQVRRWCRSARRHLPI
uniref:HDC19801 n=1 Tax=Drosophila melanogaster TaxID=7227 RepID=Q6II45_DROME|nr:TPA_inf: HDC19801 [Drosophila melanogaster]